ncbi:NAD(P)H-hydrate epimerase [Bacillus sp. FSL W8-1127]|uniref:NAD(P)H-hydrate epimerase n=1 Tax=Bacillus sp. FSL W8-1127 TaxID=2954710 RepID=UPI0030F4FE97
MHIYTSEEIRRVDSLAESNGMSPFTLMENAGREIFRLLLPHIHKQDRVLILSGRGNNGGDGIVLARYLKLNGIKADLVFPVGMPKTAPAIQHFEYFRSLGLSQSRLCGNFFGSLKIDVSHRLANHFFEFHP